MIRLAVGNAEEATWSEVSLRVRGVAIERHLELDRFEMPRVACDAVAFFGTQRPNADLLQRLLEQGLHILLSAECWSPGIDRELLLTAAWQAGLQLAIVNPDRFLPSRRLIRQQLDAGKLGDVGLVRVHRWSHARDQSIESGLPTALVQDLDMACWLAGTLPDVVYAVSVPGDSPSGRFLQVHLGFPRFGMALIDYTNRLPAGDGYQALSVIGAAGAAYADDHQNMQLAFQGGGARAFPTGEGVLRYATLVQEFADALESGRDLAAISPSWNLPSWSDVLAVAATVERSLQSRQAIPGEVR